MNKLFSKKLIKQFFDDALIPVDSVQHIVGPNYDKNWFEVITSEDSIGGPNILQVHYVLQENNAQIQWITSISDKEQNEEQNHLKILIEYTGEEEEI